MDKNYMIKSLIEMADSFESADRIIMDYTPCKTVNEKLSFLYGMFSVAIIGAHDSIDDDEETQKIDYEAVLTAIINKKWR